MKHVKKPLAVLLAIVMAMSTWSACLTVVSAATAAETIKAAVDPVASKVGNKANNNTFTYTGDDGTVLKAAEAVYNYAIGIRGGTGEKAEYNSLDTIFEKVVLDTGYTGNSYGYKTLRNFLSPTTTVYGYKNKKRSTGSYKAYKWNKPTSVDTGEVSYKDDLVKDNVTKIITVSLDINKYLLTIPSVSSIPETINTTREFKYTHTNKKDAGISSVTGRRLNYTVNWWADKWNYISSVSAKTTATNTEAKTDFVDLQNYLNTIAATQVQSLINKTESDLEKEIAAVDSDTSTVNSMVKKYSADVVKHFFSDYADTVSAYREKLVFAKNVVHAMPSIDTLVANVGKEYNKNDINEMNSLATLVVETYDSIKGYDQSVFDFVVTLDSKYASFSLESCVAYVEQLRRDINLYNLRELKATIDSDVQQYADKVSDPLNADDITDLELAALNDKFRGYITTLDSYAAYPEQVAEIFTDGTDYVSDFKATIQKKVETRNAEVEYEAFYAYFIPYLYADITLWTNDEITTRYTDDSAKNKTVKTTYNSYKGKVGQDIVDAVFTMNYAGEDMLLQNAVDIYLETLKANIIARNNTQLDKIAEYAGSSTEVTLDNFMGVKGAVSQFDQVLYDYADDNGWVDKSHKTTYGLIESLITNYNSFLTSGGLSNFQQTHYHDENGLYTTRYAGEQTDKDGNKVGYHNDIARDGAADNYDVTEESVNAVISKLDTFLNSNDFAYLLSSVDEPLDEFLMRTIADELFTDETVNMLMGILYPMLCKTFEDVWANLPTKYDVKVVGEITISYPIPLRDVITKLGLACYPNQVANKMNNAFPTAKNALKNAGNWKQLMNVDGDLTLTWDIDTIDPAKYSSMREYYTAKANKFKSALSQGLEGVSPVLRALLAEYSYSASIDGVAKASKNLFWPIGTVSLNANLDVWVDPVAGYSILIAPIFEAIGITPKTQEEVRNTLTSTSSIVNSIIDPISDFVTGTLADKPITTILNILPNVIYGLSFDRLSTLINAIRTAIHYNAKGDIYIAEVSVINSQYDINLGDLVDLNTLIKDDNGNPIALTDVNALVGYLVNSILPNADLSLPVINGGKIIHSASLNRNASTRRASSVGSRINLTADKADVFYCLLDYIVRAVGDRDFVKKLFTAINNRNTPEGTEPEPTEIPELVYKIIENVNGNPDDALAALVELFNPQEYSQKEPDWVTSDYTYSTDIENFDENSLVYLKYSNDWTREKADYLVDNVDEILLSVMKMLGMEEKTFNESLQESISGMFNNKAFTGLVKTLVKLGYSINNEFLYELIAREFTGLDLRMWAATFSDLFPEIAEKHVADGKELPDFTGVPKIDGVSAQMKDVTNEVTGETKQELVWTIDSTEFVDGDRKAFVDLFTRVCAPFAKIISVMLTGKDVSLFNKAITIKGYQGYAKSVGLIFEVLGVENVLTQAEYNALAANPADAFNGLVNQLFDWLDKLLEGNTAKKLIELLPTLVYFIQSNGLSTSLYNLLLPILVLIDDIRPLLDIDINALLSTLLSDVLNSVSDSIGTGEDISVEIDSDKLLGILTGSVPDDTNPNHKSYSIDVNKLNFTEIFKILDKFLGTNFEGSELITLGFNGLCMAPVKNSNSVNGTAYKSSIVPADTVTILITSLIEALGYEVKNESGASIGTNGEILCAFVDKLLGENSEIDVPAVYNALATLIKGLDVSVETPNWGYMFSGNWTPGADGTVTLPDHSIAYLGYDNDWTKAKAEVFNETLDDIIAYVLESAQGKTAADLISSLLNDNVYTEANLNAIVELLVNAIAGIDETLRNLIDTVIDTDIASWFSMCEAQTVEETDEATGEVTTKTVYVCTKDWGIDSAAADAKKDLFIDAIQEVLQPAESLLSAIFFGTSYDFLTGSVKDDDGNYIYNDVITVNGGKGYDFTVIPILEALGCAPKTAAEYENGDGTYNVSQAVDDILNTLLAKVDEIAGKPAHELIDLIPNILYFLNADGVKAAVNSLLAPFDALYGAISPVIGSDGEPKTLAEVLKESIGFDITDLSMEAILDILYNSTGLVLSEEMYSILTTFYIGQLTQFTSANGEYAYKMTYTDEESAADMITIVISFVLDIINRNEAILTELLGAETYKAIVDLLAGSPAFTYEDNNWAYMGEDVFAALVDPAVTDKPVNDLYSKYANDWTEATSQTLYDNLETLIGVIIKATGDNESTLGTIVKGALEGELYTDTIFDTIIETVVGALYGLDQSLVKAIGATLDADIDKLYQMCDITENEDGTVTVTCTEPWNVTDAESFGNAFEKALAPANRIIGWLFFGEDYKFLNSADGSDLITITGGKGYSFGIVPILEALGCSPKKAEAYSSANAATAAKDIVMALLNKVDEICNGNDVDGMLDLIADAVYFISADGIKNSVNNLVKPIDFLLETAKPLAGVAENEELNLNTLLGLDINIYDIGWDMIFGLIGDLGITLTDECKSFIKNFYIGSIEADTSVNGRTYYTINLGDPESVNDEKAPRRDMVTIILSIILETFETGDNRQTFENLLGKDVCDTIAAVLAQEKISFTYDNPDWAYMYAGDSALSELENKNLPPRTGDNAIIYTQYTNNWNKETASYLNNNLKEIIDAIVTAAKNDGSTVGIMLDAAITDGLYKDEILDKLLEAVVKALGNLDYAIVETVGTALGVDVNTWFNDWCDIERDENGKVTNVTCTKDWDIDSKTTNAQKKAAFISAFTQALAPANRLLAWIFFGSDYTFLNSADKTDLITINGGEGYDFGIVPILEGLGCENVKNSDEFLVDGKYDVSAAVGYVIAALCDRLSDMCSDDTLGVMLDMLPNVVYFINAGGVSASVNNILKPVYLLLNTLSPVVGDVNLDEALGFPLSNIDFKAIFDIIGDELNLHFREDSKAFVQNFYMGKVIRFTSVNGETAYRMTYSDTETRREMVTILLSLILENIKYDRNTEILTKWFGEDIYKSIINILDISAAKPMQDFSWYYTEYANTDKTFTAVETSGRYSNPYNKTWTKDFAMYIANNLESFLDNLFCLLGIKVDGTNIDNLDKFISVVIEDNLYTQENADAIIEKLRSVTAKLTTLEPYGEYIGAILKTSLDFDITAWDNMTVTVTKGDKESFANALAQIVAPAAPLFKILLTGEDVSFFIDIDKKDLITIPGSQGYAYGIIPVLEALGCENILTPEEFKAVLDRDDKAAVRAVIDPILARVSEIEDNPTDTILNMLPAIIYFINSNGLDTCVKNIVNSIDTVIAALEPAIGKTDVCTLAGIDLKTYNFDWIISSVLSSIKESTGYDLTAIALNAIAEFTVGKVITYPSKNGETYYTMEYASELDKADMITILLRVFIDFVTIDENINKIESMLKEYIPNEETYKAVCVLIETLAQLASEDPCMSRAMYVMYYIFYGLNTGVDGAHDKYHFINDKWSNVLESLENSGNPIVSGFAKDFKAGLNKYLGGIFDEGGVASEGIIPFFQNLIELIRKIINFFKTLFK